KLRIVFVCTGNTCRSSMAEALAKSWFNSHVPERTDIECISAGIAAFPGSPASTQAIQVMQDGGLDLTGHRAKLFSADLMENSDLVLTMTSGHKHVLIETFPEAAGKVFTLAEFADNSKRDISDPFAQSVGEYRKCAGEIAAFLDKALPRIL
ncbi:MAG TPA: low molecular weight protein arginine phosphatase, partial [Desulfobacteria bacterium]|nr:low molecular weight protein arginine phosphatase [Desulfobacteria bacterium]